MNGTATTASLGDADYDPVSHLNAIFGHPSTLSSIADISSTLQAYQDGLSKSITSQTHALTSSPDNSIQRLTNTKAELALLFRKIESVRTRAIKTEQTITSMTAEIKRFDNTKRNLTLSMTALKRLQMLTTAFEQLRGLAKSRQYRECASLLQVVIQLMAHFKTYRSIDQIAMLSRNVADLQRELGEQVCEDFEMAFAKGEIQQRRGVLAEGCLVMDALGDNARSRLVTWYCNTQLREYRQIFRGNDEAGSLDNIGRRYSWFKRMLKMYDEEHASIFPPGWRVNETLANVFCEGTRDDYKVILERSMRKTEGQGLNVALLLSCLQETMDFENQLEKRFANDPKRGSMDTLSSTEEKPLTFDRSISEAFEPYLSLWVDSQDGQLAVMIPKYKTQPLLPLDEEFSPQAVIASSIELFHFYKLTLSQCAKLSTGTRLLDLAKTLAKYLEEYAQQVLFYFLQRPGTSLQDTILILNTADYWHTNSVQLEENIKRRIDSELAHKVDLSNESDTFMGVASAAVLMLVHRVELDCDSSWREMRNTNWSRMESVGDQSSYVAELLKHVNAQAEEILPLVQKHQYARAFCDNLVEHLGNSYVANVIQCRPLSEVGAEQLLLDKYVLTQGLSNLLSFSPAATSHGPPTSFIKRVNQSMARLDPLLKTLQVRPSPSEGLVQAYLIHIGDKSEANFKKILEIKGVRKQDQAHLIELFQIHRDSPRTGGPELVQNSSLLTPLVIGAGDLKGGISALRPTITSGVYSPGVNAKFNANAFGEKLFSAARDGVERIGSATSTPVGTPGEPSNAQQAREGSMERADGDVKAGMNENLRSIGKFFRREKTGFGARFGGKVSGSIDDTSK